MGRPSMEEKLELERLETIAVLLASALQAAGVVAVRLRQAERRAPGVMVVTAPAHQELQQVVDDCDQAWELLRLVLDDKQRRRLKTNKPPETD